MNIYSRMQKEFYDKGASQMAAGNHQEHNANPDYYGILLGDINHIWDNKLALDFGCGCGRNIENLLKLAKWNRVDGCDISKKNLEYAKLNLEKAGFSLDQFQLYENSGEDLSVISTEVYDFVLSTITFQHICVHNIRFSLLKEIYRILKFGGLFSFQMGFGPARNTTVNYFENNYYAKTTNGGCDVRLEKEADLINDLLKIGYKIKDVQIRDSFSDNTHPKWIYVKATK